MRVRTWTSPCSPTLSSRRMWWSHQPRRPSAGAEVGDGGRQPRRARAGVGARTWTAPRRRGCRGNTASAFRTAWNAASCPAVGIGAAVAVAVIAVDPGRALSRLPGGREDRFASSGDTHAAPTPLPPETARPTTAPSAAEPGAPTLKRPFAPQALDTPVRAAVAQLSGPRGGTHARVWVVPRQGRRGDTVPRPLRLAQCHFQKVSHGRGARP